MSKTAAISPPSAIVPNLEGVGLLVLIVATAVAALGVPASSWLASPVDPCHLAVLGGIASTAALTVTRFLGDRALAAERLIAAVFLFVMPFIYLGTYLLSPQPAGATPWLFIELAAVPVYGALAVAGFRGRPWLLVLGIATHGIGWDSWHYGHSAYIPDWYAVGCLMLDVPMALYVAARIPRWRAAEA
jgi:hypothetical protein